MIWIAFFTTTGNPQDFYLLIDWRTVEVEEGDGARLTTFYLLTPLICSFIYW